MAQIELASQPHTSCNVVLICGCSEIVFFNKIVAQVIRLLSKRRNFILLN